MSDYLSPASRASAHRLSSADDLHLFTMRTAILHRATHPPLPSHGPDAKPALPPSPPPPPPNADGHTAPTTAGTPSTRSRIRVLGTHKASDAMNMTTLKEAMQNETSPFTLQYLQKLRAVEENWRRWADEPLSGHNTNERGKPAKTPATSRAARATGMGSGSADAPCVGTEQVLRPHPATQPFQFLLGGSGASHDPSHATRTGHTPNPHHLALTLKSGYHAVREAPHGVLDKRNDDYAAMRFAPSMNTSVQDHSSMNESGDAGHRHKGNGNVDGTQRQYKQQQHQLTPPNATAWPLLSLSQRLGERHEVRYAQLKQRLQELHPDMWYRALPSYAALDATPQLMDTDVNFSHSRVARQVQDSGAVVI